MAKELSSEDSPQDGEIVVSRLEQAWEMKQAGVPDLEICITCKFESPEQLNRAFTTQLNYETQFVTQHQREGLLALQNARYATMLRALWPSVQLGDPKSVAAAVQVMSRIDKVNKLEAMEASSGQQMMLVLSGDQDEYINKLQSMAHD